MAKLAQYLHLLVTLVGVIGVPTLAQSWLTQPTHGAIFAVLVAVSVVLHAICPSIFGGPSSQATTAAKLSMFVLLALALTLPLHAQTVTPTQTPTGIQNLYGAGGSYSVNASPAVAGTALYAHQVTTSGTYAFTVVDAVPNTLKPFTVTSNIGIGVAQQVATIGKVPVFIPTSAGVSWTGGNTGWQWNGGVMAAIHIKGNYYLLPSVRFLKSSVSNGTGYQPILGLLFGWGK